MEGFYNKIICQSSEVLLVAGLCKKGTGTLNYNKCFHLKSLRFKKTDDIYDIDLALADALSEVFGSDVYVAGASVKVSHICYASGGVIGVPSSPAKSSEGKIEYIGNRLFMYSCSGGPGVAAKCEKKDIEELSKIIITAKDDKSECINMLKKYFAKKRIEDYLIVFDGSGNKNTTAYLICKAGEKYVVPSNVQNKAIIAIK